MHAFGGKALRHGLANTAGCAGNNGDFILEALHAFEFIKRGGRMRLTGGGAQCFFGTVPVFFREAVRIIAFFPESEGQARNFFSAEGSSGSDDRFGDGYFFDDGRGGTGELRVTMRGLLRLRRGDGGSRRRLGAFGWLRIRDCLFTYRSGR